MERTLLQTIARLIEQNLSISILSLIVIGIFIVLVFNSASKIDEKINNNSKNDKKNK